MRAGLSLGLVAGVTTVAWVGVASAAQVGLSGSSFEIDSDANLIVDTTGGIDWASVTESRKADLPSGTSDDSFGQGTKEDTAVPSVVAGSIPPNKSDLKTFGTYLETTADGTKFLHMFWNRVQDPTGTTNMDFEFNQSKTLSTNGVTPVRTAGDLLIQYDLANGGTSPQLFLSRWRTAAAQGACEASNSYPCWGTRSNLTTAGDATGSINTTAITAANSDGLGAMSARTFGEASVNFSDIVGNSTCTSFGSAYLKSRSSDSFTAATKDFIAPAPTNINNCGTIIIEKVTQGGSGSFGFTSSTLSPASWTLTTTGSGVANKDSREFDNVLAGTYDAAETVPAGWDLTSATCSDNSPVSAIALSAGETVTCTFTNTAKASLKVAKETLPDGSTQSFTFTKTSGFPTSDTFALRDGQDTGTTYADIDPGTYVVTETVPSGWRSPPAIVCTGDTGTTHLSSGSGTAATFDLQPGENVTCTFTNTQLAKVSITKTDDASPANAVAGATFSVYEDLAPASTSSPGAEDLAAAPVATCTTDSAGACSTGNVLDPAKAYWVVETTTPAGYTTAAPQRITPTAGQNVPLSFVNQREFTVITIVCRNGTNPSLYPSTVTLDGVDKTSLSAPPSGITEAQLCALGGASYSPKHYGNHPGAVNIPQ